MAGWPKTTIDGKTLDPRIALMANRRPRDRRWRRLPRQMVREGMKAGFAVIDARRRPERDGDGEMTVPGGGGAAPARPAPHARQPDRERAAARLFHQGGCVIGGLWTCDTWCSILAEDARAVVLNVDYRHARNTNSRPPWTTPSPPTNGPSPTPGALGADGKRIGVGGDSAGGYLSNVVCHAMKKAGKVQPALQLLIYPAVDWDRDRRHHGFDGERLSADLGDDGLVRWVLSQQPGRTSDWRVLPALDADQSGLAPALIYNAGFDPLTAQGAGTPRG